VCTSIGEEGLDIGEVDLIVCYDASASPIRMLQRMGRTGRKRDGKIILLMTEGREEENHKKSQQGYKNVQKSINEGRKMNFVKPVFRMGFPKPVCEKKELVIVQGDMQRQRELKKSGSSMSSESDTKRKKSKTVEKENAAKEKMDSNKSSKPKKRKKSIAISELMDINESEDDIVTLSQIIGQGNNATSNRDIKPSKKESPHRLVPSTSIELTIPKETKNENLYGKQKSTER
jgi:ATP-dependent DNA helicase MPH1